MKVKVLHNQSLLDIAIQHTGSVLNAFSIAVANNISISDILIPGTVLSVPSKMDFETEIKDYYTSKGIRPASAIVEENITVIPLAGINYWQIEETFEVQ